jgi:aminoglycoside phosphotransferase family enzyme
LWARPASPNDIDEHRCRFRRHPTSKLFASAADRAAFTNELVDAVTSLVAKYHDERAEGGREHHLVIAVHPSVTAATAAEIEET